MKKQDIWWHLLMKIKSEHFETKFLKLSKDKEQMTYTNEKLKWFEIIRASVSISAKFIIFTKIIADSELTKKHKFKKLKKSISEFNSVNEKLSVVNVKDIIFVDDTLQTSNIMNQQTETIISDYCSKTSRLSDDDWRKTLKKCKHASKDNDKKSSLIKR